MGRIKRFQKGFENDDLGDHAGFVLDARAMRLLEVNVEYTPDVPGTKLQIQEVPPFENCWILLPNRLYAIENIKPSLVIHAQAVKDHCESSHAIVDVERAIVAREPNDEYGAQHHCTFPTTYYAFRHRVVFACRFRRSAGELGAYQIAWIHLSLHDFYLKAKCVD